MAGYKHSELRILTTALKYTLIKIFMFIFFSWVGVTYYKTYIAVSLVSKTDINSYLAVLVEKK